MCVCVCVYLCDMRVMLGLLYRAKDSSNYACFEPLMELKIVRQFRV